MGERRGGRWPAGPCAAVRGEAVGSKAIGRGVRGEAALGAGRRAGACPGELRPCGRAPPVGEGAAAVTRALLMGSAGWKRESDGLGDPRLLAGVWGVW